MHSRKLTKKTPESRWLGDDPFMMGFGLFEQGSCFKCQVKDWPFDTLRYLYPQGVDTYVARIWGSTSLGEHVYPTAVSMHVPF